MAAFIAFSILAHLLSLLAIIVLYKKRSVERLNLPTFEEDVQTIHESLESFVDELEKENEALYQKLIEYVQKKEAEQNDQQQKMQDEINRILDRLDTLEARQSDTDRDDSHVGEQHTLHQNDLNSEYGRKEEDSPRVNRDRVSGRNGEEPHATSSHHQSDEDGGTVSNRVRSERTVSVENRNQKVIEYYQQGLNIEEIAQTLQIGKGEAQLVINMFQRSMVHRLNSSSKPQ